MKKKEITIAAAGNIIELMRLIEESAIEILEYPTVNWQSARVRGVTK